MEEKVLIKFRNIVKEFDGTIVLKGIKLMLSCIFSKLKMSTSFEVDIFNINIINFPLIF